MCLPSIIEIADRAGLECDPRSRNKKEVLYKCPFCLGDANRRKYKLSLNPVYNVYKCWLCGESGGVLQFEAKLFNLPYDEVKRKYFKNRNYHPAEMLSPKQLKLISWDEAKRRNHEHFKRSLDEVLRDWKEYEREQKILHFAKLIVIAHIQNEERKFELLTYLAESCYETNVKNLFSTILEEYMLDESERAEWTHEGLKLARAAWRTSLQTYDFDFDQVVINVVMLHYLERIKINLGED